MVFGACVFVCLFGFVSGMCLCAYIGSLVFMYSVEDRKYEQCGLVLGAINESHAANISIPNCLPLGAVHNFQEQRANVSQKFTESKNKTAFNFLENLLP